MAHDMRNHLQISNSALSVLSEKITDPEAKKIIKCINASNLEINNIVTSNIELDRLLSDPHHDWVNIHKLIQNMTEYLPSVYQTEKVEIKITNTIPPNTHIYIIPFALRSIISNLIVNSCKYTYSGGIYIEFCISNKNYGLSEFIFTISDTAGGLPHTVQQFLLGNCEYKDVKNIKGTGMGIKIIKSMLPLTKGILEFDHISDLSKITVKFTTRQLIMNESPSNKYEVEQKFIHRKHILIVDDNKVIIKMLDFMLSGYFNVNVAYNGEECLEILSRHPEISVILMDLHMPIMDGLTAAQRIRQIYQKSI